MRILGKLMHHVRLVSGMARATGTDLVAASRNGDLSQEDWAEMVQTCRKCAWAGRCVEWQDSQDGNASAPKPCLNRAKFEAIKRQTANAEAE